MKSLPKKKSAADSLGEAWEIDTFENKRDSVFENSVSRSVLRNLKLDLTQDSRQHDMLLSEPSIIEAKEERLPSIS